MVYEGDIKLAAQAITSNKAVLYLGSGVSMEATNKLGNKLPSGFGFSKDLWKLLKYEGEYDNTPLDRLYEATVSKVPHDAIRTLLNDTFNCEGSIPAWYDIIPAIYWHRIYTTNIDNLIEKVYKRNAAAPKLQIINGIRDDYKDRDQLLESIQYIKLNGNIPFDDLSHFSPRDITFSFLNYAQRSTDFEPWYWNLSRDYCAYVTFFLGTSLNEPLFWQAVQQRGIKYDGGEARSRCFLVRPTISEADKDSLKQLNITPIELSAEQFFTIIHKEIGTPPNRKEVLLSTNPKMESMFALLGPGISLYRRRQLETFYRIFQPVSKPDRFKFPRKGFLSGSEPQWEDLYANLDANRDFNKELEFLIESYHKSGPPAVIGITGSAGSGKSTSLRRVALNLASKGLPVFFADCSELATSHVFNDALDLLPRPSIIILDHAGLAFGYIEDYIRSVNACTIKHTLVICDRTNTLSSKLDELELIARVLKRLPIPHLSTNDIVEVLKVLDNNHMLGYLSNKSQEVQIKTFAEWAQHQILVAMRRVTSGEEFNVIIKDEYLEIKPLEAQMLYLCACIADSVGLSLTKEQFLSCSPASAGEVLFLVKKNLNDVLVPLENGRYRPRHQVISELIATEIAVRGQLKNCYIRVLRAISYNLVIGSHPGDGLTRFYRKLINHARLYRLFEEDIENARAIYDSIAKNLAKDCQFWLQFGSLELEYGELDSASNFIEQALAIDPDNKLALTAKAHLLYRQAYQANSKTVAMNLRDEARKLVLFQMGSAQNKSHHPFHIYCSQELYWIQRWLTSKAELTPALYDLTVKVGELLEQSPCPEMKQIQKQISDAYLDTAKL